MGIQLIIKSKIKDITGDAMVTGDKIYICMKNIEKNMIKSGKYYFDEVFFHESIYGEKAFNIRQYFECSFDNFTTDELLEQEDELLYNQDPYLGVILIDEYIAQHIAQQLVMKKYDYLNGNDKRQYFYDENLTKYKERIITTNICYPPEKIRTSLADYPEFDIFASTIINKYGYDKEKFIKDSLHKDMVRELISNCKKNYQLQSLYKDLCYLGIIKERLYLLKRFQKNR